MSDTLLIPTERYGNNMVKPSSALICNSNSDHQGTTTRNFHKKMCAYKNRSCAETTHSAVHHFKGLPRQTLEDPYGASPQLLFKERCRFLQSIVDKACTCRDRAIGPALAAWQWENAGPRGVI